MQWYRTNRQWWEPLKARRGVLMRLLVTGASGQLGRDVVRSGTASGDEVIAADHRSLDINDRDAVLGALTSVRPDAVVNCAAWTAVDACESDPTAAFATNAAAVRWVAEGCHRVGAHLVHLSTDYVFDGTLERPYHEWDTPAPGSVYGASKLGGEHEALELGADAAVVRTSWVCGEHGSNMVTLVRRLAAERAGQVGGWRSSTTSAAARRSPPTSVRCCGESLSIAAPGSSM